MGLWLKQSVAVTINLGPFVDSTNGNDEETGLTIADSDVYIAKNGADFAAKADTNDCVHNANGWYHTFLGTGDTDTLGILQVRCHPTGALQVWREYMIVPTNVWDSLFGADKLQVDVREKGDSALDFTTTEKASVNTACDDALNTAVPGVPTADSINERVKQLDDNFTSTISGRIDANITTRSSHSAADVWAVGTRALTDKADFTLSSTGIDSIHDEVLEGTVTSRQAARLLLSALTGKLSGGGTSTLTFRDIGDTKDRIVATVDANHNRTAITTRDGT